MPEPKNPQRRHRRIAVHMPVRISTIDPETDPRTEMKQIFEERDPVYWDLADAMVVGAGTVQGEGYGPPRLPGKRIGRFFFPFEWTSYLGMLPWTCLLAVAGFTFIYFWWGGIIVDDLIGMALVLPVVNYLLFLVGELR